VGLGGAGSGFARHVAHVERAIDSYLGRAKDEFRDAGAAKKLHALVQKHDLLLPTEDYLSPMIEATVGRMYQALLAWSTSRSATRWMTPQPWCQ
jgi:hypothetical protein